MATTFNMLRANDLIWSFVVNNYLLGKEPFPFDLLYWNADSTRMPAAMHSFYLRKMYQENLLVEPGGIDARRRADRPAQDQAAGLLLSTREDHIAPWKSTYAATQLYRGRSTSCWRAPAISPAWSTRRAANTATGPIGAAARPGGLARRRQPAAGLLVAGLGGRGCQHFAGELVPARQPGDGKLKAARGRARQLRPGPRGIDPNPVRPAGGARRGALPMSNRRGRAPRHRRPAPGFWWAHKEFEPWTR